MNMCTSDPLLCSGHMAKYRNLHEFMKGIGDKYPYGDLVLISVNEEENSITIQFNKQHVKVKRNDFAYAI